MAPQSPVDTRGLPVYAVLAAAGSGTRLGFDQPKAFVSLAGRTLLERALDGLADSGEIGETIVMVSEDMRPVAENLLTDPTNQIVWAGMRTRVVIGGGERTDSVYAGLETIERSLGTSVDCVQLAEVSEAIVLVHDAARCLTPPAMIRRVVAAVREGVASGKIAGVAPAMPVTDTVKVVDGARITDTPPRETLRAVQTPQGFLFSFLLDANRKYLAAQELSFGRAEVATDDASIMEIADYAVDIVPGDDQAMKITTPRDFAVAQMLVGDQGGNEQ